MKNLVRLSFCALVVSIFGGMTVEAQNITTVAGGGPPSGPTPVVSKTAAGVGAAAAVKQDALGNTYIMDNNLGRIFKVDTLGNVTLFAGNGVLGFSGEGGLAVNASLFEPSGMCVDPTTNNVYVADSDNGIIREIPVATLNGKIANHIYTVAGVQAQSGFDFAGDGAAATSAHLHFPDGCAFDSHGNMYIADRGNNEIRVVIGALGVLPVGVTPPITPGFIYRFAGGNNGAPPNPPTGGYGADGTAAVTAPIYGPFDVFVDSHNNVFFADLGNNFPPAGPNKNPAPFNNNVIREILASDGTIHTVAGTPGVAGVGHTTGVLATTALLNQPIGISVDAAGDLFFADQVNQVIREVPAATAGAMTAGFIYDVAGVAGVRGYLTEPSAATANNLNFPAGTFVTTAGTLLIADSNNDRVRQVVTGTINTFAGNGSNSFSNGTPATAGQLNVVAGVAISALGNLAIADVGPSNDHQSLIRGVAAPILSGALTTVAGQLGFSGFSNTAPFVVNNGLGVAYDSAGNLYIADTANCIVRKITGAAIATVAGMEPTTPDPVNHPEVTVPQCGFNVQGGAAVGTELGAVNGVAIDASGNVFFSDATNNVIWEVPATTIGTMNAGSAYIVVGMQSTTGAFAGEGIAANQARLHTPTGISFDIYGNLFIADTGNNLIREVPSVNVTTPVPMTAGSIYTVAGASDQSAGFTPDGQPANGAKLNAPFTAVADNAGNIFIADTNNQVVREVAATTAGGRIAGDLYTVAGTHGSAGFSGDGAAATLAQLNFPKGLAINVHDAVAGKADLLIGDSSNNRVRSVAAIANEAAVPTVSFDKNTLTFLPQSVNIASATQVVTLSNNGTAPLTGIAIPATSGDFSDTTTCAATLAAGANCTITVTFTPSALGARSATLSIADNAVGNPQKITLSGTGIAGVPADVLTPNPLTFATSVVVGVASAPQVITLSNATGTAPLTLTTAITNANITGANAGEFTQTNNCGTSVAVGASCTITVTFTPTSATPPARTATLTVTDNAPDSPQTVTLAGTAVLPALTLNLGAGASGSTSATVTAGQTATYNLQISANQNVSVSFACTGAPKAATCAAPASVAVTAGTPAAVTVTVSTTARGLLVPRSEPATRMQPPAAIQLLPLSVLATLLLVALLAATQSPAGRLRVARVTLSACLVLMPIMAATLVGGCGGGSSGTTPPPAATGTPAGTYTVTVTATSGSTTTSTPLTLIVQ